MCGEETTFFILLVTRQLLFGKSDGIRMPYISIGFARGEMNRVMDSSVLTSFVVCIGALPNYFVAIAVTAKHLLNS